MNKRITYALLLVAVSVVVLIANTRGSSEVTVDLLFTELRALKSIIFFGFMGVGLIIGVLIK